MKVSKKAAACLCALMMATSSIAVFSVSAADTEGQAASETQTTTEVTESENVKIGKVTEIDGSQLTVALGEFSGKKARTKAAEGEEATEEARHSKMKARSAEEQADVQTDSETQPSENEKTAESESAEADGTQTAEKKAGGRKRRGKDGRHGKFTENGTTETVTVSDDVTVTKKGETVSASDISVGDIVKLKYDENDDLAEVKVSAKHKHGRKAAEAAAEDSTADTDQSATA